MEVFPHLMPFSYWYMKTDEEVLQALSQGEIDMKGEFIWGSNYTFLVEVQQNEGHLTAVYKPTRGERPLWDFPTASLARREAAAYLVSEALGWRLVPPTIYRRKGPLGAGSLQLFIPHDPEYNYFTFSEQDRQRLRPAVLFDLLINNADRKGSHVLRDPDDHFWLIDHGLCFHVEEKLRTVIWDFVGEPIPPDLCTDISEFIIKVFPSSNSSSEHSGELAEALQRLISPSELRALARRAEALVVSASFPAPDMSRRPFPWPQI